MSILSWRHPYANKLLDTSYVPSLPDPSCSNLEVSLCSLQHQVFEKKLSDSIQTRFLRKEIFRLKILSLKLFFQMSVSRWYVRKHFAKKIR